VNSMKQDQRKVYTVEFGNLKFEVRFFKINRNTCLFKFF
jgi:hypothetical protein